MFVLRGTSQTTVEPLCISQLFQERALDIRRYNSHHLGRKYARIFVVGHYLFLEVHSFPRATLSENYSLLGTDNVRRQIS